MRKKHTQRARVNMIWKGDELVNLNECRALLRLNDEAATVRYLVSRGMEAMSAQLGIRRMMNKMETQYSPQEMLPLIEKMGGTS